MTSPKKIWTEKKVGGTIIEELFTEFLKEKFNTTPERISQLLLADESKEKSLPIYILRHPKLSSLEAIVKFLRENRKISYNKMSELLGRKPKALASTYTVAHRKAPELFDNAIDDDKERIPFTVFTEGLSILECICVYLKSQGKSYAEISRMLNKDQRTVWTVCNRAGKKSKKSETKSEKNANVDDGRRQR